MISSSANDWDAEGIWSSYSPSDEEPWNLHRVVHLHRRAGFAATWNELQRDLRDGPSKSLDRLLQGQAREGGPDNFHTVANLLASGASDSGRLKAWWMYRMYAGPDPLGERLTLLWHNHFATSNDKVKNVEVMRRQNEIFREYGRGPFGELLKAVVHDPAMLVWLDAPANRKGRPNENLARELMELFTLGVGHYNETDVKEAARTLTGWKLGQGIFRDWATAHDDGDKTLLGQRGRWNGDDLLRMLLEQFATSRRLAWRICDWLMGEKAVSSEAHRCPGRRPAATRSEHRLGRRNRPPLTDLLRRRQHGQPGSGTGRVCYRRGAGTGARFDPPPSSLVLAEWAARLGQDLFYPPNVGGWNGGRDWLTSQAIIGRANYAAALVQGQLSARPVPLDGIALARRHQCGRDFDDILTFYVELLTGSSPDPALRRRLSAALGPKPRLEPDTVRTAVVLVVASPEVQMA